MPVIRAVLFSSAFHLLVIVALLWLAPLLTKTAPETIEVDFYPEGQILEALTPKENKKQIVRQALAPEKLRAPDDETLARFLSEQKQRVRQETQAANSGMTANRNNASTATPEPQPTPSRTRNNSKAQQELAREKDGYKAVDITKDLKEMNRYSDGMSTTGDRLPQEVTIGSFTALNTDRYTYYTFYARIEEQIRFRWESRVQATINSFNQTNLFQFGNRNWTTHVEFLLDKKGFLQKALIMRESGIPLFDAAALLAFRDARVFPNPPQEMVEEDGYIHIKYSFTVNFNPKAIAGDY